MDLKKRFSSNINTVFTEKEWNNWYVIFEIFISSNKQKQEKKLDDPDKLRL